MRSLDGAALATVGAAQLELPRGASTLALAGAISVDPYDAAAVGCLQALLGAYASGVDTALHGVVLNVSSPLYDAALRQLALPVLLPGLQARALHLREQTSPRSGGDQREIRTRSPRGQRQIRARSGGDRKHSERRSGADQGEIKRRSRTRRR